MVLKKFRLLLAALFLIPVIAQAQRVRPDTTKQKSDTSKKTAAGLASAHLGRPVSNDDIAKALKNSGLTQQQVRDRLKGMGYDPSLADPFFAKEMAGVSATPRRAPSNDFVRALTQLGLISQGDQTAGEQAAGVKTDSTGKELL